MKLPTASTHPRCLECPASWVLPQVRTTSEAAEHGIEVHAKLEAGGVDLTGVDPDELAPGDREVSLSWTVPQGEYTGRADVLEVADVVTVTDYKTGRNIGPPEDSAQLKSLALMACRASDIESARVQVGYVWGTGRIWYERADLDALDLMEHEGRLLKLAETIQTLKDAYGRGEVLSVRQGEHCKYCPAMSYCPAFTALTRQWLDDEEISQRLIDGMTPDNIGDVYRAVRRLEGMLAPVKKALLFWSMRDPIPLGDGRFWGLVEKKTERFVPEQAAKVLTEQYGKGVAEAARKLTPSYAKDRLREALKPLKVQTGKTLKELEREALDALRAAGGLETKMSEKPEEYRRKD